MSTTTQATTRTCGYGYRARARCSFHVSTPRYPQTPAGQEQAWLRLRQCLRVECAKCTATRYWLGHVLALGVTALVEPAQAHRPRCRM